ncbi:DeoR/GlpR family DNA-binding transcription regulator [Planococcus donghaensis]|uniref:DeoR family transcriptional regulator n=1 Tax=Planococcus donghaensis TaxID=414778 RepID=A0A1C7EHJ8_9BACL|nr:DeoR/GlpR family DNA-binding transcription regulator [Planococcus donghaensis]ANU23258.1 DeoR family transcriptional regulator [Planococcus donghaensis]
MLTNERHLFIMQLLDEKQTVKIQELVESTGASESTIRRDLVDLEHSGKLERVFGGATLAGKNLLEPSILDKSTQLLDEKIKIAKFAASFVQQGDSVYLDAGTTTFQMIPFLKDKDLVVVTNGLTLVEALNSHGITTYLTGGLMKPRTGAFVGSQTIQALQNYRFDSCFLGINGFHAEYGYTTPDPEEAAVKQMASSLSRKTFALADHSKINKISFAKIMDLERATLIVDEITKDANAVLEKKTIVKVVKL